MSDSSAPLKLVKADGPGIQKRLYEAFSDGYEMSLENLRSLLVDCGCAKDAVDSVMQSTVLEVNVIFICR